MLFDYFKNISFAQPQYFLLLLVIPVLIYFYFFKKNKLQSAVKVSTLDNISPFPSFRSSFRELPFLLRILCLIFIIIALTRPQISNEEQNVEGEGIDIVLCIDVSGSMTAQDLLPNRLEAAKKVAADFVNKRVADRIGIVIFSGESFTQCPLTTDKAVLISSIENITNGLLEDGTAIGAGLGTSIDRLRQGKSKSKVVILMTDGENNSGLIDPKTAKEIAKTFAVKVYTIGVGTLEGYARQPVQTSMGIIYQNTKVSIDEKLLTEIATETGGKYFRAKDNEGLTGIYAEIDKLEKSTVTITTTIKYTDKFFPFVIIALLLIFLEVFFKYVVFRKFP
ncbi:MAG: VWA domain-containing protein [Chitinophagaceae bacterium]|nr:VWA domain-containing protein [Chitinophagaceae bacterium]